MNKAATSIPLGTYEGVWLLDHAQGYVWFSEKLPNCPPRWLWCFVSCLPHSCSSTLTAFGAMGVFNVGRLNDILSQFVFIASSWVMCCWVSFHMLVVCITSLVKWLFIWNGCCLVHFVWFGDCFCCAAYWTWELTHSRQVLYHQLHLSVPPVSLTQLPIVFCHWVFVWLLFFFFVCLNICMFECIWGVHMWIRVSLCMYAKAQVEVIWCVLLDCSPLCILRQSLLLNLVLTTWLIWLACFL